MKAFKEIYARCKRILASHGIGNRRAASPAEEYRMVQSGFAAMGGHWTNEGKDTLPIAVIWGAGKHEISYLSQYFSNYRTAFARPPAYWVNRKRALDSLSHFVFFSFFEELPPYLKNYLKKRGIGISYLSFQDLVLRRGEGDMRAERPRFAGRFATGILNWRDGEPERRPLLIVGAPEYLWPSLAAALKSWSVFFDSCRPIPDDAVAQAYRHVLKEIDDLAIALWEGVPREPFAAFIGNQAGPLYLLQKGMLEGSAAPGSVNGPLSYVFVPLPESPEARSLDQAYAALLNTADFENAHESLEDSASLMKIMRALEISRHGLPPQISSCRQDYLFNYAGRHRVLIVGEPLSGLEENVRMFSEARRLYPESEILYLPDPAETPDIAQSLKKHGEITIVSDCGKVAWLLEEVDCVFVCGSSVGLEAIWHGCEVHVFGHAFYAGWGLTADHCPQQNRRRVLNKEQLFCGIFILGHQYRLGSNADSPVRNLLAVIFEICYKRSVAFDTKLTPDFIIGNMDDIAKSGCSPVLLNAAAQEEYGGKHQAEILNLLRSSTIFTLSGGGIYQETVACCILGIISRKSNEYLPFLEYLRTSLPLESYEKIVSSIEPAERPSRIEYFKFILHKAHFEFEQAIELKRRTLSCCNSEIQTRPVPKEESGSLKEADLSAMFEIAALEVERRNLDAALKMYYLLLAEGCPPKRILPSILEIARLRFDFRSLPALGDLLYYLHVPSELRKAQTFFPRVTDLLYQGSGVCDEAGALKALVQYAVWGRLHLTRETRALDILSEKFGELPYGLALYDMSIVNHLGGVLDTSSTLISLGEVEEAARMLSAYNPAREEYHPYTILTTKIQRLQGDYGRAKKILSEAVRRWPANQAIHFEIIDLIAQTYDVDFYDEWKDVLYKYHSGPMLSSFFPIFYLTDDFKKFRVAWQDFNVIDMQKRIRRYFSPEKLITRFEEAVQKKARNILV